MAIRFDGELAIRSVVMKQIDPATREAVLRFLALMGDRYDMAGALVYGSRARGTHRPDSDADVAVILRGEHQRFLTVKLDMADVAFDVLLETGILISPLPIWIDEWEQPESHATPIQACFTASPGRESGCDW
jgi:uncharacterized protein